MHMMSGHSHSHSHPTPPQHGYEAGSSGTGGHGVTATPDSRLIFSLAFNLLITLLQVVGGIIANSLGLLSDAAHNLSDVVALALSLWAVRLGRRGRTSTRTFAYKRAEILVALFNSAVLVGISIYLVVEAIRRLLEPEPVQGLWVVAFAAAGLVINLVSAVLLRSHLHDLNMRAAFLHLVGDAATSFGVMLSGVLVYFTDWSYADPLVSIVVSVWITRQAVAIIRSTVNVLMEGTPEGVKFEEVETAILAMPLVRGVHDLHVWALSSSDLALSGHIEVDETALSEPTAVLATIKRMLAEQFGIGHATLEIEIAGGECAGGTCVVAPELSAQTNRHHVEGPGYLGHRH